MNVLLWEYQDSLIGKKRGVFLYSLTRPEEVMISDTSLFVRS